MTAQSTIQPIGRSIFVLLLTVIFTISLGYGVVLPVLPYFLETVTPSALRYTVSWHTGMLASLYMFAVFLFSPVWGKLSDRMGRRPVILIGIAGFVGSLLLLGLARGIWLVHTARVLSGLFAAAVIPVTQAYVSETCEGEQRTHRFAWVSTASLLGFLAGPSLSGALTRMKDGMPFGMTVQRVMFALPFFSVALLSAILWLVVLIRLPEVRRATPRATPQDREATTAKGRSIRLLLFLTLLGTFGLGLFEVGLTLQGQQILRLGAAEISLMFTECSVVMLVVQLLLLPVLERQFARQYKAVILLTLVLMALSFGLIPRISGYGSLMVLVGIISASSGILVPLLSYRISVEAGPAQGTGMGQQTAFSSLGQALGSAAAGFFFDDINTGIFWIATGLLAIGIVASFRLHRASVSLVPAQVTTARTERTAMKTRGPKK